MVVAKILYGPAIYFLGNDEATVWWVTDTIEGGLNGLQAWSTGNPPVFWPSRIRTVEDEVTNSAIYSHSVRLTGLVQNGYQNFRIQAFNFLTAVPYVFRTYRNDGASVRLGLWGNSEGNNTGSTPGLLDTLARLDARVVDGYLSVGSIVGNGALVGDWKSWATATASRLVSKGLSLCRGETDGYGSVAKAMLPFPVYDDYFAVSIGLARVVGLNSVNRRNIRNPSAQTSWFLNTETPSNAWKTAQYRIVLVNQPYRTTWWRDSFDFGDATGTDQDLFRFLLPMLQASGADIVLQGRSRSYQRGVIDSTYPNNHHQIIHMVSGGGGAPKNQTRRWTWPPPNIPNILFDSNEYHGLVFDISSTRMSIECQGFESGTVLDSINIAPHTLF